MGDQRGSCKERWRRSVDLGGRTKDMHIIHMSKSSILGTAQVGAFVSTRDRAKAKAFYGETLGLTLIHEDGYAIVFDACGTTLRVSPVKELRPQPFTVLGWHVPDVAATVKALTAAGVVFERFEGVPQGLRVHAPARVGD